MSDTAYIKVRISDRVPVLPLGNSDCNRPGEKIILISHSFYTEETPEINIHYINKLKDDTPQSLKHKKNIELEKNGINCFTSLGVVRPGCAGGPIVNMNGEVVGVISSSHVRNDKDIIDHQVSSIPINFFKTFIKKIDAENGLKQTFYGMDIVPAYPGLEILNVSPKSPAEKAGLKVGDVIVVLNGIKINSLEDLYSSNDIENISFLDCIFVRNNKKNRTKINL